MAVPWRQAIIVGASSGMGAEIARLLAAEGCRVALVARRETELARLAEEINAGRLALTPSETEGEKGRVARSAVDETARGEGETEQGGGTVPPSPAERGTSEANREGGQGVRSALLYPHDVTCYEEVPALFQRICRDLGGLDLIVYAAGVMPRIAENEYTFEKDRRMVEVNLLGAVAWLNEAAQRFEKAGDGTIVGLSSVAGDRGRRGQPVYCTTKAALNTYLEGLRNRIGRFGVAVVTVKPGPVDTPMTAGLDKLPMLISPQEAARQILAAARRRAHTAYVPGKWRLVMFVLRSIPSFLFKKMNV